MAGKKSSAKTSAAADTSAPETNTTIDDNRMTEAVDAIMPLMVRPEMVRVMLRNLKWSREEIAEHEVAVIKAVAARFSDGE